MRADRRAERLHHPLLIVAHRGLERLDVGLRIGQARHRFGPVEIRALAPRDASRLTMPSIASSSPSDWSNSRWPSVVVATTMRALSRRAASIISSPVSSISSRRARAVIDQHRLAAAQLRAAQHLLGRRAAGLAHEAEMIARRRAVKGQRAALGEQLEAARKGGLAGVADDIVGAACRRSAARYSAISGAPAASQARAASASSGTVV